MSLSIHTERTFAAPPAAVWETLINLPEYILWNPFIVQAEGRVEKGQRLDIRLRLDNTTFRFRPKVTELHPQHTLEWLGHLGIPGIFDGRHCFELHKTPWGGTRFIQSETFTGLAVRLIPGLEQKTHAGFERMNGALDRRVGAMR